MARKYEYNLVIEKDHDCCPLDELLTDKEKVSICRERCARRFPKTVKVKVDRDSIYRFFGARFSDGLDNEEKIKPYIPKETAGETKPKRRVPGRPLFIRNGVLYGF